MSRNKLKILSAVMFLGLAALPQRSLADANGQAAFWKYQCIDTVKYSRDTARAWNGKDAELNALISSQMQLIKNSGANCVALGTPYDPEFVPFLTKWVNAARADNLTVWFRGNLSGWEGWFNYPKLTSWQQHNAGIYSFITQNPQIFRDGDIFTPAPEPENGILGNPFSSPQAAQNLKTFLASSYQNCQKAFSVIGKNVSCGYFSTNGDVAKDILDKQTVRTIGNMVVVDHYVKTADQLGSDLQNLHDEFGTNVFLGEFGAPIPDINGNMTETQQANFVGQILAKAYAENSFIIGVNYWDLAGGSASLTNADGSVRQAYGVIKDYYDPGKVVGTVHNDAGDTLADVKISPDGIHFAATDSKGNFSLPIPAGQNIRLNAEQDGYSASSAQITLNPAQTSQINFILSSSHPSIFYEIKKFFRKIFRDTPDNNGR